MQHAEKAIKQANRLTSPTTAHVRFSLTNTKPMLPKLFISLLLSVTLVACSGGGTQDLRNYVKDVKARQKGHIPPLPQVKTYETYTYNDKELRDPFIPTLKKSGTTTAGGKGNGLRPDPSRKRDVLEQFPLDTLKMVGILERNHQRWALIKSEDGTLYRTKTGRYIGQNNGKITRITESSIELREIVPDGLGGWVKRQSTLSVTQ